MHKKIATETIKMLLLSFIVSFVLYKFSSLDINFFAYMFIYFLSFLIPFPWMKNKSIKNSTKILLLVFIGVIGSLSIYHLYGYGKTLSRYIILFCFVYTCIAIIEYLKKTHRN